MRNLKLNSVISLQTGYINSFQKLYYIVQYGTNIKLYTKINYNLKC